jgi:hypothetical protein
MDQQAVFGGHDHNSGKGPVFQGSAKYFYVQSAYIAFGNVFC